jgi:molecular chaperone IbpA
MKFDTVNLPHMDRYFVGADRVMKRLADIADQSAQMMPIKYPPYNIKKVDESRYVIELAVAGFGKSEIDIELQEGLLSIRGKIDPVDNTEYLYKGIAERGFKREFTLADNVEVKSSTLVNGMLKIWLEAFIPEEKKAKKIDITDGDNEYPSQAAEFLAEGKTK